MMKKKFIHYPKSGNRMVARTILDFLESNRLTDPGQVQAALKMETPHGEP
jgi:hypothetical protein